MRRNVDVAIIGAGTAGLGALAEVRKKTDSWVLIDGGELGTTCARVGCMPSKAFIQIATDFHRRNIFHRYGIEGADQLSINSEESMESVRDLRDLFVDRILEGTTESWSEPVNVTLEAQWHRACREPSIAPLPHAGLVVAADSGGQTRLWTRLDDGATGG